MSVEESTPGGQPPNPPAQQSRERHGRDRQVLDDVERTGQTAPRIREERVTLAHGAAGDAHDSLIETIFRTDVAEPAETLADAARLTLDGVRLAFTTGAYPISPAASSTDVGDDAISETARALTAAGAVPVYVSVGLILYEGFPIAELRRVATAMRVAADAAGVLIVPGETTVVERGRADVGHVTTAGLGVYRGDDGLLVGAGLGVTSVWPGDVLVAGPLTTGPLDTGRLESGPFDPGPFDPGPLGPGPLVSGAPGDGTLMSETNDVSEADDV